MGHECFTVARMGHVGCKNPIMGNVFCKPMCVICLRVAAYLKVSKTKKFQICWVHQRHSKAISVYIRKYFLDSLELMLDLMCKKSKYQKPKTEIKKKMKKKIKWKTQN